MTNLRMDEGIKERLERKLKEQPNRTGLFILSVANAEEKVEYELDPIEDRQAAIESLASQYRSERGPLRRALIVSSPEQWRAVGTYFVEIDERRRLASDELLVLERFHGLNDRGEYHICSPELKAAVEQEVTSAAPSSKPRV